MKVRREWQILAVMVCAALLTAPALAGDVEPVDGETHGVCTLDGAWWGWAPLSDVVDVIRAHAAATEAAR